MIASSCFKTSHNVSVKIRNKALVAQLLSQCYSSILCCEWKLRKAWAILNGLWLWSTKQFRWLKMMAIKYFVILYFGQIAHHSLTSL